MGCGAEGEGGQGRTPLERRCIGEGGRDRVGGEREGRGRGGEREVWSVLGVQMEDVDR